MKGLKENAYKCIHTGGFPPLGYNVDAGTKRYVINEDEAKTVKKIFEMYTSGYGYKQILQYLNSMGYKTKFGIPCFEKASYGGEENRITSERFEIFRYIHKLL